MLFFSSIVFAQNGENPSTTENTVYESCKEAKEKGVSNIKKGEPGYSLSLDRNKDDIACNSGDEPTVGSVVDSVIESVVTYANCDEAKAKGVTNIKKGSPGYSADLDRDGDGVACDADSSIHLDEERKNISYVGRDKFIELTSVKKNWKDYNIQSQLKKEKVVQVQEHSVPPTDGLIPNPTEQLEQPILPPNGLMPSPTVPPTQ